METPIVTITEGTIQGNQRTNLCGDKFYSFLGIVYGKSPVGDLRFKAPEPVEPWDDVRDGTKEGNHCIQRNEMTCSVNGSEDCLNLNVFTKTLPSQDATLKPVMVWIHGGGYVIGSNNTQNYGPEHLMIEDIVLVSINYRLGVLGFLRLDDLSLDIPGNAGLKDQQLALKWVQRNIKYFNGDPENVTIFGESAGSFSVHYHILSPSSKGLFHKAILQSGCLRPGPAFENYALDFGKFIDENVKTEKELLKILGRLSAEELFAYQNGFREKYGRKLITFPCIEKPNKTAVLTSSPENLMMLGQYNHVPIMLGYTNNEGLLFEVVERYPELFGKMPGVFELEHNVFITEDNPRKDIIFKKFKKLYFEGENANNKYLLPGDNYLVMPTLFAARIFANTSLFPVYLYSMSLDSGLNFWKRFYDLTHLPGVCHADDLGYLFNVAFAANKMKKGDAEIQSVKRFVKLWTNFAKYGTPTPEGNDLNITWKPIDKDEIYYLDIGENLSLQINPIPERIEAWDEIYNLK